MTRFAKRLRVAFEKGRSAKGLRGAAAIALAGVVLLAAGAVSAAHVSLDPQFRAASLNWYFDVAVKVDLEPQEDIRAFSVSVLYDPSVVSFVDAEIGDPILGNQLELSGPSRFTESIAQGGCCSNAWVNVFDTINESDAAARAAELAAIEDRQADSFTLATVRFRADTMATTELEPYVYALAGLDGTPLDVTSEGFMLYSEEELLDGGGGGGEEVFITTKMPEPHSALLFSVAIAAGAWRARRRPRRRST